MSVLCCHVPHLLITLACRQSPDLASRTLALLGPDERVWAASSEASQCGVATYMGAQHARAVCPDLIMRTLDLGGAEAEQSAPLLNAGHPVPERRGLLAPMRTGEPVA